MAIYTPSEQTPPPSQPRGSLQASLRARADLASPRSRACDGRTRCHLGADFCPLPSVTLGFPHLAEGVLRENPRTSRPVYDNPSARMGEQNPPVLCSGGLYSQGVGDASLLEQ